MYDWVSKKLFLFNKTGLRPVSRIAQELVLKGAYYPPASKVSREIANLTKRKNL